MLGVVLKEVLLESLQGFVALGEFLFELFTEVSVLGELFWFHWVEDVEISVH